MLDALAKRDSLHTRRQVLAMVPDIEVVGRVFGTIAPRFGERNGGYTRIIKTGRRPGDDAPKVLLEDHAIRRDPIARVQRDEVLDRALHQVLEGVAERAVVGLAQIGKARDALGLERYALSKHAEIVQVVYDILSEESK